MIDKLLDYGIKKETIDKIKEVDFLKYNFEVNLEDCIEIIDYLKSLNIANIDDLILYVPDIFINTKENLEFLFSKKDINNIVSLINEDYTNIDLLFDNN